MSFVHIFSGEGIVALYAAPNHLLLNKICLNQNEHRGNVLRQNIYVFDQWN